MARQIKMSVAVMNLRIHPHSAELYVDLFRTVYRQKSPSQVHGERYGLVSTADFSRAEEGEISGVITTFTKFDGDGNWFDTENLEEADDEKIAEIRIPEGLFPNAASYFFHFDVGSHRMYVETYSRGKTITPPSILRFLRGLFSHPKVVGRFGEPSISIVQTTVGLANLFSIERIKKIEIRLEKPNADVFADDFEEQVERHLLESNSQTMTVTYDAVPGQSVKPVEQIRKIGTAALENGEVTVTGRDNGVAVKRSSAKFPRIIQDKYDPELTSERQAFNRLIPRKG